MGTMRARLLPAVTAIGVFIGIIGVGQSVGQTVADAPATTSIPRVFSVGGSASGYIDTTGESVKQPERNYGVQCRYREGLAAFSVEGGYWGFMDAAGQVVIPAKFGYAEDFSEGLAAVCTGSYEDVGGGFIAECCPPIIDTTGRDDEGDGDGSYGFIDRAGPYVVQPQYDTVGPFSGGVARVSWSGDNGEGERWGYIDARGGLVIKIAPTYDSHGDLQRTWGGDFHEGLAYFHERQGYGYIDKTGAKVIAAQYSEAEDFSDGLALVRQMRGRRLEHCA